MFFDIYFWREKNSLTLNFILQNQKESETKMSKSLQSRRTVKSKSPSANGMKTADIMSYFTKSPKKDVQKAKVELEKKREEINEPDSNSEDVSRQITTFYFYLI